MGSSSWPPASSHRHQPAPSAPLLPSDRPPAPLETWFPVQGRLVVGATSYRRLEAVLGSTWTLAQRIGRGRVERWRADGRVRWRIHGFRRGPQSGSHGDVSSAPPKMPYIEFSPARLQAKACCHQPCPSHTAPELKCQVRIPSGTSRFDMTFVACPSCGLPLALSASPPQAHRRDHLGPRALCSERVMVSRSSLPLRPDPPVSTTPPDFPSSVIQEALPDNLVWAASDTFPALGQYSFHTCRHLYAGRRSRPYPRTATLLHGLPHQNSESAPPMFPTSASVGALLSTLLPVFALLRPARLLALLDRSDLERHRSPAAEDFSTRAFPRKVTLPASRVSLHGARGRTP